MPFLLIFSAIQTQQYLRLSSILMKLIPRDQMSRGPPCFPLYLPRSLATAFSRAKRTAASSLAAVLGGRSRARPRGPVVVRSASSSVALELELA
jgi:hypothetical protein